MVWKASTAHIVIKPGTGLHIYMEPQIAGQPQIFMPPGVDVIVAHPSKPLGVIRILTVNGNLAEFSDPVGNIRIMTKATPADPSDPVTTHGMYSEYWIVR